MGQVPVYELPEFGLLKAALEQEWPARRAVLHASGTPLNEDPDPDPTPDPTPDPDPDPDPEPVTFDAEYVRKLREENAKRRRENQELAGRIRSFEDADKTDLQRAEEARAEAERRAAAAEGSSLRLDVALEKAPDGMSIAQVRKLAKRLSGNTREELEADADELFADFTTGSGGQEPPAGRPRERLRPGATHSSGNEPEETDPAKLAAMVRPMY